MIFLTIKFTADIILLSTVVIKPILCKGGYDVIKHTKADIDIDVKVYLREKKGYYYAVLVYKNISGARREKWVATKLTVRGNKTKAKSVCDQLLHDFEIPDEDIYFQNVSENNKSSIVDNTVKVEMIPPEILENATLDDLSPEQIANLPYSVYLEKYLPYTRKGKKRIEDVTYASYCSMAKSPIIPYFKKLKVKLKDLTAKHIQDFYDKQLERVKGTTVVRYHGIIRLSLCYARKMRYIKENPIDEVDKPEKSQYVGNFYTAEELKEAISLARGTYLEVPVIMGGFYGLRRSEVVGLRWSAFDFDNNIFYINHTVNTCKIDGETKIIAKDRAKTKSSLRALPLDEGVKKRLLEIKEKQEANQKKYKRSYSKEWLGYVLVDELGGLILPNYITGAWASFVEKHGLRKIRFHDLRHTCASLLLNKGKHNGITLKDIQVWLGHSDFATTANIYSHLDASSKVSSLDTLSNIVSIE